MSIQADTELQPITHLDFVPRCSIPLGHRPEHGTCRHPAAWSATVSHTPGESCGPSAHLLCGCCRDTLLRLPLPWRCQICCTTLRVRDELITNVVRLK